MHFLRFILFLWQLPQCLLGLLYFLWLFLKNTPLQVSNDAIQGEVFNSVCLGEFVFVKSDNAQTLAHELGHRKQSRMLGSFYLLVVGIPSLCLNIASRFSQPIRSNYYKVFPENWADKLGGVQNRE